MDIFFVSQVEVIHDHKSIYGIVFLPPFLSVSQNGAGTIFVYRTTSLRILHRQQFNVSKTCEGR
jgi:hypothetical protein